MQAGTEILMDRQVSSIPSLMAGPIHDLGARLGLGATGLGLAVAGVLWAILVLLAAAAGGLDRLFALHFIAGHVRILVALPLILACESVAEAALGPFVRGMVASKIVRGASATALQRECDRFNCLTSSRLGEGLLLIVATLPSWIAVDIVPLGATAMRPVGSGNESALAGYWYWLVCLPLFRFVLLRAAFRLAVWYFFLWRLSRMDLNLLPTHPDRLGGLSILSEVQIGFILMTAAISAVVSAAIAEGMAMQGIPLQEHYGTIIVAMLICAAVFIAPLYIFAGRLWRVRLRGRAEYADLAASYVGAFDAKWLRGCAREDELLGSADLQSLADLGNSVQVIDEMMIAPVNWDMVKHYAAAALVPMLPLLLFEFPLQEIAGRVLEKLLGG